MDLNLFASSKDVLGFKVEGSIIMGIVYIFR